MQEENEKKSTMSPEEFDRLMKRYYILLGENHEVIEI